ncbi:MAG: type I restriction endonuclease subunit R [Chloroflexi bacterium]|nr:type I restriction endonuclease subunit R [Chloroflexota bacterium]
MPSLTESIVEDAALGWFTELGYTVLHGPDIAPGQPQAERATYGDVVLVERLRAALARLNPAIPAAALDEAARKLLRADSPSPIEHNRHVHRYLTDGVPVDYQADGRTVFANARLIDVDRPAANDWLAVNQFTVIEHKHNRRPDIVIFVNGLPLAVIELKNAADANATIKGAFNQLQTYQTDIPSLFPYSAVLVISDGLAARAGTITAAWERFMPWRTVDGVTLAPPTTPELEVLINGMFERRRFLDLVARFIVFEDDGTTIDKKLAAYHQFHAVTKAVDSTARAAAPTGDRRIGVVWHTQGSGKSLSMVFYAGAIAQHPAMANPTLVVLTDRNDLDGQLFDTFARCAQVLRQTPVQADSRAHLRDLLRVASGGVIFTTIQKFAPEPGERYPLLSDRRNIVVIADEAHRSQYDFIDGFARHLRDGLPHASFIGFTGTPIEAADRNTQAVFGDYIDVYDIQRAVDDGATVRIYYEARLAKLALKDEERPKIDPAFEDVTEGEEAAVKERLRSRWARLEAMVGNERRIGLVAADLVAHFEDRLAAIEGKAMIVGMSRRICVELYDAIVKLRPDWHSTDDRQGAIKVVMTGSAADPPTWQPHIRPKAARQALADRFKDEADPLKLVIVRDMWLTGFDAPVMHTMYLDKPMQGHGLMQAIARVNRVFKDKPGGLIVDYLGLAEQLKKALATYTESGGQGGVAIDQAEAVAILLEKHEIAAALFHGFDHSAFITGTPAERLQLIPPAMEHILTHEDGKARLLKVVTELSKAFALAVPADAALAIRDDVAFFQAVRAAFVKATVTDGKPEDELDAAVRQIISRAITSDEVVDLYAAAGLKHPDLSILSDEFLAEVRDLPQRNLALEVLRKLLNDEITTRARSNIVQGRSFAEKLEQAIRRYQNRTIESAAVIAELIELAKELRAAQQRGEELGLSESELAFYDALEVNDSAVHELGDETLRQIARELVETVRRNATIDWSVRESARAKLRLLVKRLLRKYNYPPDKQEQATQTVLQQAELLGAAWAA